MPDHVHLFARGAPDGKPLALWMQTWKSLSSRRLATALPQTTPIWQKDYFDRYVRSSESYGEKWDYVCANPLRKGLVDSQEAWPWQGVIEDLMF